MNFKIIPLLMLIAASALAGCASRPLVEANGLYYEALTPKEEQELVTIARSAILNARKKLQPGEDTLIRRQAPEVKIIYYDNLYGNAMISWYSPERKLTVQFTGALLTPNMNMQLYTVRTGEKIIDFSRRKHQIKTVPASAENNRTGLSSSAKGAKPAPHNKELKK